MSVKSEVLNLLEQSGERPISGQEMAEKLLVSRSAIWKAVNSLREDGYIINATTNKGYILGKENDLISEQGIKQYLDISNKKIQIHTYKTITSTNTMAKKMAIEGALDRTILIAEEQTQGRGRYGKSFFSPSGSGIYMSIIIKPNLNLEDPQLITIYTAVSVCRAIEKLTVLSPKIKWVNDIFLNKKKICGILTEATSDFESRTIESIIIGIGINISTREEDFPQELLSIAGSLFPKDVTRNKLIAGILNELFIGINNMNREELINEYKARSFVLGMDISYDKNGEIIYGKAVDINQNGNLVVKTRDGKTEILNSGEISIKWDR
ncbi:biotin--[acetyl-CoA-carboxylase] ligase [Tissierella creatinini]|nr:biotin--[acetyl-CoA-carboxylase] ligase [Tissierella creatinini]TJX66736.1 biotin--[acetyl-CoA-carboxylase] ligase [Soehngenia saccharolytica]